MKQLIEDNYDSIVKRKLITPDTTNFDFISKLFEEVKEVENSTTMKELSFELADVILTALNFAKHFDIDIEYYLNKK